MMEQERADILVTLIAARVRISQGWTRNALAMDKHGVRVNPMSAEATRWDVVGAVRAVTPTDTAAERGALDALRRVGDIAMLSFWNDEPARTHDEVIMLFDTTIASLVNPS